MPYIPHSQAELEEMLATVGVKTLDDLFAEEFDDLLGGGDFDFWK